MSCSICSHITGHAPDCVQGLADRQRDQDDLGARVVALEEKIDRLEGMVLDYAHLKKLYAESRDYVKTLEQERDDLIEANRRNVAENNQLDVAVEKLRAGMISTRGFLLGAARRPELGSGSKDLLDEAAAIGRVLEEVPGR